MLEEKVLLRDAVTEKIIEIHLDIIQFTMASAQKS